MYVCVCGGVIIHDGIFRKVSLSNKGLFTCIWDDAHQRSDKWNFKQLLAFVREPEKKCVCVCVICMSYRSVLVFTQCIVLASCVCIRENKEKKGEKREKKEGSESFMFLSSLSSMDCTYFNETLIKQSAQIFYLHLGFKSLTSCL